MSVSVRHRGAPCAFRDAAHRAHRDDPNGRRPVVALRRLSDRNGAVDDDLDSERLRLGPAGPYGRTERRRSVRSLESIAYQN